MSPRSSTALFVLLAALHGRSQFPVKLITLPTLDTTTVIAMVERPGAGYIMLTRQGGTDGAGSTLIMTDDTGTPLSAMHTPDKFYKLVLCSDSGYLMLGQGASQALGQGSTLVKTDAQLNILWARKVVAPPFNWFPGDVVEKAGSIYLAANVMASQIHDFELNYGARAAILYKFSDAGELMDQVILADTTQSLWQNDLNQPTPAVSDDGSVYLAVSLRPEALSGTCNNEPTVIKLDADLDVQWGYRYPMSSYSYLRGLTVLRTGDLALQGEFALNTSACNDFRQFLQVIDTAGNVEWAKDYHHAVPNSHSMGRPLLLADSTLLFPQVYSTGTFMVHDRYFQHVDAQGNTIGLKRFDHPVDNFTFLTSLADAGLGSIAVCRTNAVDTLLFTRIDTSLTTLCYTQPEQVIDSAITVYRSAFAPSLLFYEFTFSDTLYPAFEPVPTSSFEGCDISTHAQGSEIGHLRIFPNPSAGVVQISSARPVTELVVTDVLGRVVHRSRPDRAELTLGLPSAGVFIVRVIHPEGEHVTRLIVEGR